MRFFLLTAYTVGSSSHAAEVTGRRLRGVVRSVEDMSSFLSYTSLFGPFKDAGRR